MIKVKNSRADDPLHDDVVVVVTNIFPSKICHSIGRLLDPNRDDPTETGIEEIKPISKALRDVLKARGVRADTLDRCEFVGVHCNIQPWLTLVLYCVSQMSAT
jgi:hypothetical protein